MRTTDASAQERFLSLFERYALAARDAGLVRVRIEDHNLDAAYITVGGRKLLNFGSCAYLGLNTDERLKEGAKMAGSIRELADNLKQDPSQIIRPSASKRGVVIPK